MTIKVTDIISPWNINLLFSMAAGVLLGWFLKGKWHRQLTLRASSARQGPETQITTPGDSGEYKMVLVVRSDLKMGKGKVAAQCSHAAVGCYRRADSEQPDVLKRWLNCGQPKVVVKAPDEDTLFSLAQHARSVGLVTTLIQDAGRTQIAPGSRTVLGVGPGHAETIDSVTGELKLY
ncbi:Peptidyl-tRNA hydrolase 2, mitochondrial [Holothuria leucospilota]|uniref:peptidyl-tRNA hydrolase n=1 Tax=Holothuria leucospilota TaxID=206669 RepID=A0A9Q1CDV2_HOLLE|nr:Peptidyl-tRNA hydrolase 2, mitochondrial [Holothuria leucospilota]